MYNHNYVIVHVFKMQKLRATVMNIVSKISFSSYFNQSL